MPIRLTLYAKAGCHLCEVMHAVVDDVRRALAGRVETRLETVDITTSSELMQRYRFDIPVLAIDGAERFRHRVDRGALEAALREAAENAAGRRE